MIYFDIFDEEYIFDEDAFDDAFSKWSSKQKESFKKLPREEQERLRKNHNDRMNQQINFVNSMFPSEDEINKQFEARKRQREEETRRRNAELDEQLRKQIKSSQDEIEKREILDREKERLMKKHNVEERLKEVDRQKKEADRQANELLNNRKQQREQEIISQKQLKNKKVNNLPYYGMMGAGAVGAGISGKRLYDLNKKTDELYKQYRRTGGKMSKQEWLKKEKLKAGLGAAGSGVLIAGGYIGGYNNYKRNK